MSQREGYLMIDLRDSPGVPAAGLAAGSLTECATMTCLHCNGVVILNPGRTRARGYCARCDGYVCDKPGCAIECRPFLKLLDDFTGG